MGRNLTNGTIADHSIPQESRGYIKKQDVDPDSVHTVTGTHSLANNTSISVTELFLQNCELFPYQIESNLTNCYI
jgi:hypothetical protein